MLCMRSVYAQDYIPLENNIGFPSKISIINQKANIIYPKSNYSFVYDKKFSGFLDNLDNGKQLAISPKGNVLLVTLVDQENKKYKTAYYRWTGLKLPQKNKYYILPPSEDNFYLSSMNFIVSYPFWSGIQTARGYDLLSYKERGIIRMFPYLSAEIAHKLCESKKPTAGLFQILEGQGIECKKLEEKFTALTMRSDFSKFQGNLSSEREVVQHVFECGQGLRDSKTCENVSKILSKRALTIKPISSIL